MTLKIYRPAPPPLRVSRPPAWDNAAALAALRRAIRAGRLTEADAEGMLLTLAAGRLWDRLRRRP